MLDLSVTTVSRGLAGYPDVSTATRARIEQEAARIDYRPNQVARRLRSGRSGTVGIVVPAEPGSFDMFFLAMLGAIGPLLSRAGLDLVMMGAPPGEAEMHAYRHLVEHHRVDGLVVARTRRNDARIRFLLDRGVPFVTHGRTEETRAYAHLDIDGEAAFAQATRRLIGFGHRHIGLLNAPEDYMFAHLRAEGWRHALAQAGLPQGPAVHAEPSEENGYVLMRRLTGVAGPAERGAMRHRPHGGGRAARAGFGPVACGARRIRHRLRRSADRDLHRPAADHLGAADRAHGAADGGDAAGAAGRRGRRRPRRRVASRLCRASVGRSGLSRMRTNR